MLRIVFAFITFLIFATEIVKADEVVIFKQGNWEQILEQAEREKKTIFIDAYTKWCTPCKMMDEYVFTDPTVAAFYNREFLNVKVDMEEWTGLEIAGIFNISSYPTLLFVNSDAKILYKHTGGLVSGTKFLQLGAKALDSRQHIRYLEGEIRGGDQSEIVLSSYMAALKSAGKDYSNAKKVYLNLYGNSSHPEYVLSDLQPFVGIDDLGWIANLSSKDKANTAALATQLQNFFGKFLTDRTRTDQYSKLIQSLKQMSFDGKGLILNKMEFGKMEKEGNWNALTDLTKKHFSSNRLYLLKASNTLLKRSSDYDNALSFAQKAMALKMDNSSIDAYANALAKVKNPKKAAKMRKKLLTKI